MKDVLYTSPYVPAEWIAAHGLRPVRISPTAGGAQGPLSRQGVCSFVRCFAASADAWPDTCGIVMTTTCDQMRRARDVVAQRGAAPAFLMNVPTVRQSPSSRGMYLDELKRLGDFLVGLGGAAPSDEYLAEVMVSFGDARASLLAHEARMRPKRLAEAIMEFGETGRFDAVKEDDWGESPDGPVPVALVGGPLRKEDLAIFELVEESGGCIVLDASETGRAGMCRPFDRDNVRDKPLAELADAYFDGIRDISRRPNDRFYAWFTRECEHNGVHAVIVHRYIWCDLWHAEVERIRQRTGLPVLDLDVGGDESPDNGRTHTRVKAFMEMLV